MLPRRPGDPARSEHPDQRRLVRRQPLSGSGRDRARALDPPATDSSLGQPSPTVPTSASEAGFAFMWHSHNEREITTNNIFPGGMMMMMLVDSREFVDRRDQLTRRTEMRSNYLKTTLKTAVLRSICSPPRSRACQFAQQQVNLTAAPTTLTLPDGSVVPMWGYTLHCRGSSSVHQAESSGDRVVPCRNNSSHGNGPHD